MPMPSRSLGFNTEEQGSLGFGFGPAAGLAPAGLRTRCWPGAGAGSALDAVQEQGLGRIRPNSRAGVAGLGPVRPNSRAGAAGSGPARPNSRAGIAGSGPIRPDSRPGTGAGQSQEQGFGLAGTRPRSRGRAGPGAGLVHDATQDPSLHEKEDRLRHPTSESMPSAEDAEVDRLDWTNEPTVQVIKDGNTRVFIAEPESKGPRRHLPFLVRELDLQPAAPLRKDFEVAEAPQGNKPAEFLVRERDLRRCGSDLTMLSKCALPKMQTTIDPTLQSKINRDTSSRMRRCRSSGMPVAGTRLPAGALGMTVGEAWNAWNANKCKEPDAEAEQKGATQPSETAKAVRMVEKQAPEAKRLAPHKVEKQPPEAKKFALQRVQRQPPEAKKFMETEDSFWSKLEANAGMGPSHILSPEEGPDPAPLGGGPASVILGMKASAPPAATYFSQRALRLAAAMPSSPCSASLLKAAAYAAETKVPPPLELLNRGGLICGPRLLLPGQAF
mmetsp:Transcript_130712/g.279522  ORF Transcript_130712/g.279522 Transcript_130712/m.279522 type:complete len:498 (-) Transcript_130712:450-1943(-)